MSDCGCQHEATNPTERKVLLVALALNAAMAVIGGIAGWVSQSKGGVNLRASWIFTRADVVANVVVILSGALVALLQSRYPDLIIGTLIGLYVIREAFEILAEARKCKSESAPA